MLDMKSTGPANGYAASQSGSDFDFGTPQSIVVDTMMHGSEMSGSSVAPYRSIPGAISANMQSYVSPFDQTLVGQAALQNGQLQHRGSMSSMPDDTSPIHNHQHRLSISSSGPLGNNGRHNSYGGSDGTSPDGNRVQGSIGDNPMAQNSNDTVDSQNTGEDGSKGNADGSSHPPPPWSELKTKAGKERKRLPLACIACRRKKIKCSGETPACKHCLRSRIPCVYKVTTRKAAPRTDYMAMLDKRLKRMEERVIKVIPKEDQGVVTHTGRAVVKPPLPPPPLKSAGSKKRVADAAFEEDLDDWANAKAPETAAKDSSMVDGEKEPLKKQPAEEHNLMREGADKLPPMDIQEHLAEIFFDFVYCQSYPLLHKPSFMRRLAQGTVPPVLTLAVCAISARFSNHPEVRTEPAFLRGEQWAAPARDISLRRYDTPNLTVLIVYLILGLHEFGTCQGGRSWMFGGMGQRMAYALQLHKDLDHDPGATETEQKDEMTFTDREIRRRAMWSCFLMDRFSSSGTDRPHFVGEQYIKAQLPIKESHFQMEITGPTEDIDGNVPNPLPEESGQLADATENMGIMAYLIRLVGIWGRLVNYLNLGGKEKDDHPMWVEGSTFQDIKHSLREWREALPANMHYTSENLQTHASEKMANQYIFLHITYNQLVLFMNRFALPVPGSRPSFPKDMPADFIQDASRSAHEAANQISVLVNEGMDHHVVAPFAGYSAFLSSTVHIYGAFSKNPALEASSKQNLAWNVKYLTKMKNYWGMFHFVTENLRDLYKRHADAARSGSKSKAGEQTIFQYGDWFDRYPHGVSGTDYEEPSAEVKKEPGAEVLGQKSDLQSVEEFFSKLSPPSRTLSNQAQQPTGRKVARRRQSKNESKQSNTSSRQQEQDDNSAPAGQSMNDTVMAQQGYANNMQALAQPHSTAFPPGFQPPPNPLLLTPPQQQMMSQLDRQMVLNSYAGVNPPANASQSQFSNPMLIPTSNPSGMNDFDFQQMLGAANLWGDPSTAWFMPFNMDPPAIGDDTNNNWFASNLDWGSFGGLNGLDVGLGTTGLTPGRDLELDVGADDGGGGLEGLRDL